MSKAGSGVRTSSGSTTSVPCGPPAGTSSTAVKDGDKVYVKVINTSEKPQDVEFAFNGLKKKETVKAVERIDFTSGLLYEDNTLDAPDRIAPVKAAFAGEGKSLTATVPPQCFTIFILER